MRAHSDNTSALYMSSTLHLSGACMQAFVTFQLYYFAFTSAFESLQVTDWLDYVLGKSDQPPSFMRREGPPERKRKKKPGEGSGGGGSSSRGTPPASLAAGGGSARAIFSGAGPRAGPFGQVS
jgi:hypothetical protein